jgi:hypothetical protein
MLITPTHLERPCTRCGDVEASVVVESLPGGPPLREAGELCASCASLVVGGQEKVADPLEGLARLDPAKRLERIESVRRNLGDDLALARRQCVIDLRRRGWSWREIGDVAGVTRARAQQLGRPARRR